MRVPWCQAASLWLFAPIAVRSSPLATQKAPVVDSKRIHGWSKGTYPHPRNDPVECRTDAGTFCDPDALISNKSDMKLLEDSLRLSRPWSLSCTFDNQTTIQQNATISFSVAFLRKLDARRIAKLDEGSGAQVEDFARHLYDSWLTNGTSATTCPDAGILILLVEQDHLIYVARGPALSERLSDRRVERTLEQIQPMLRQGRYADAIVDMVERIHFDILHGDSHDCRVPYRFLLGMGLCFVAQLALSSAIEFAYRHRVFRSKPKEQQWSELDRIHAESLKSRFQAYSCPICLNGFRGSHVGADDKPLKLLRCGHVLDTTCWDAWEMACLLNGSAAKCPICRHDGELADICGPTSIHSQVANH